MNSNYNDIIDVILTFAYDKQLENLIIVSGSIVPYLILNKESNEFHKDLYMFIPEDKIDFVRRKITKLSKEYLFDIITDSKKSSKFDYGFKIKYEDTIVGFFPYFIEENNLIIKTYSLDNDQKEIALKTRTIPNVTKNSVIRQINFNKDKTLKIMSPEFILVDKKIRDNSFNNMSKQTKELLNKISDESVLKVLTNSFTQQTVNIKKQKIKDTTLILNTILIILLFILLILAYICFKK